MEYENMNNNFHQMYGKLLLTPHQVSLLNKYNIDYNDFNNLHELIYYLEECLNSYPNEELELLSEQLSEYYYYHNINK